MGKLFILFYDYFKPRKALFVGLLTLIFLGFGLLASQLRFEEDISQVIPTNDKIKQANLVFQNSRFLERVVVNITASDSTKQLSANKLIKVADQFSKEVKTTLAPNYLEEVRYKISNNQMADMYGFFYEKLPIYLDEADYKLLEERTAEDGLRKSLKKSYKTLLSPAGMVLKDQILNDPIGMTGLGLSKLSSMQIEGNFTIHNNHVFTKDKKNLFVFLTPANNSNETAINGELFATLDSIIAKNEAEYEGKVNINYFGPAAVAVGNANQIKNDINLTVTIALVLLLIFISLFFRSKSVFFQIFLPGLFGAVISLGFLYLILGKVSLIALGVGSVLLGITLDFSLHLFTHFRSTGKIKQTIRDIAASIVMSAITTGCAFLCLLLVRSQAMNQLGMFAAFAVITAALFALILLPQLLSEKQHTAPKQTLLDRIAGYDYHKNKILMALVGVLFIIALFTYRNFGFETDMDRLNYMSPQLKAAEDQLNNISNVSLKSVYLVSEGKSLEEALQHSQALHKTLNQLSDQLVIEQFASVNSLLISKAEQKRRIQRWQDFWTAERKASVQERLIRESAKFKFKKDAFKSFYSFLDQPVEPFELTDFQQIRQLFLNEYISEKDGSTTLLTVLKTTEENKPAIYKAFNENDHTVVLDRGYLTGQLIKILREDFNLLVTVSLFLVLGLLILAFGRIELGLMTFLPILIGWVITLGIMSLFDIKFNIINIILSTFIFGLGIDYCIFISRGLLQEYTYGINHLGSYKTSILLSAVTTITGIGVLIFAKHPALRSIALVSVVGISSVVLVAFTLLPFLFNVFLLNRKRKGFFPYTAFNFLTSVVAFVYFAVGSLFLSLLGIILFPFLLLVLGRDRVKLIFHYFIMYGTRVLIYGMLHVKKVIINPNKEDFSTPKVIVANHTSFLDILLLLMLHPKVIMLTNDWVYNSPFFGKIVQFGDFFPTSIGLEGNIDKLQTVVDKGYSIIVYPEGTRSVDGQIGRFHKGAFYIAEQLKLEILPVILHGVHDTNKKSDFLVNTGVMTVKFLDGIKPDDPRFGNGYKERSKQIRKHFVAEYRQTQEAIETVDYYKDRLIKNYVYKGPVIENYVKVKVKLEDNYRLYESLTPKQGEIIDLGCGMGLLSYMLSFTSKERTVFGIDYDADKIRIAQNGFAKGTNLSFAQGDITKFEFRAADTYIISDVLHYLPEAKQREVIANCLQHLRKDGILLIREGDASLSDRQKGTRLTEFFSVRLLGFNKAASGTLYFTGRELIEEVAREHGFAVEVMDSSKLTSNVLYVLSTAK